MPVHRSKARRSNRSRIQKRRAKTSASRFRRKSRPNKRSKIPRIGGGNSFSTPSDPFLDDQQRRLQEIQSIVNEQERRFLDGSSVQEFTLLEMHRRLTHIASSLIGRRTSSPQRLAETSIQAQEMIAQVLRLITEAKARKGKPRFSPYGRDRARRGDKDRDRERGRKTARDDADLQRRMDEIRDFSRGL